MSERADLLRSAERLEAQAKELRLRAASFERAQHVYTVTAEHVGTPDCFGHGGRWLAIDVGKRVSMSHGHYQVENDDQLRARLAYRTA